MAKTGAEKVAPGCNSWMGAKKVTPGCNSWSKKAGKGMGANNASKKAGKGAIKKTALAKNTGAKTSTTKNRRGQAHPLLLSAWHAWLGHVRNQEPAWLYVALSLTHLL